MMFYYTYVLISTIDGNFYVGYTKDLKNRIADHNDGKVKSTKNRRPLKIVYCEASLNKDDAIHREKYSPREINDFNLTT
jgi:putative endonuclease